MEREKEEKAKERRESERKKRKRKKEERESERKKRKRKKEEKAKERRERHPPCLDSSYTQLKHTLPIVSHSRTHS